MSEIQMSPLSSAMARNAGRALDDLERARVGLSGINWESVPEERRDMLCNAMRQNFTLIDSLATIFECWREEYSF